jgi:predicted dehydrogenase
MSNPTRRTFLGTAATAAALAATTRAAAGDKLVVGVMGMGGRGTELSKIFAAQPNVTVAYVCDPDPARAGKAADGLVKANRPKPEAVADFRKLLDDKAVDVLVCAAPNHWHAPAGIFGCAAGKHCYIEKPCSHTPREGEMLVAAARKHNKVVQMGNQRRSWPKVQEAIAKLHEGIIGRVYFAQAWYMANRESIGEGKPGDPPAGLDYDLWQGPSTRKEFRSNYLHYTWHWFWHWGNGELGNNGIHTLDLLRWGLGVEAPVKVTSAGGRYRYKDDQQTPDTHVVSYDFAEGKTATWEGLSCNRNPGGNAFDCLFHGEKGTMTISDKAYTVFDPKGKEISTEPVKGGDTAIHVANFLAAVRGDAKPNSEIALGATSTLLCHLGNIAHRVGRTLHCDAKTGAIHNDPDAMKLWTKEYAPAFEPKV